MNFEAIFFDWDGVITDSVNIKTESYCDMFKEFGHDILEKVKRHHLQNGGVSRFEKFKLYYKEYLGTEINQEKINELADRFSNLVKTKVVNAPFIEGALETIKSEYQKGTKLFIVSGTPTDEIQEIAKLKGIEKYFVEICGSPKKKGIWVKELLDKYALSPDKCIFIGDAMADYNAAKENGLEFLGIKIPSSETEFPFGTTIKRKVEL